MAVIAACASPLALAPAARAGTLWVWMCGTWTTDSGVARAIKGTGYEVNAAPPCPKGGLTIDTKGTSADGDRAAWQVSAPQGLELVGAWVPPSQMYEIGINDGKGHGGGFYWKSGGAKLRARTTWSSPKFASPYFGWQVVCRLHSCKASKSFARLVIYEIELKAEENRAPSLTTSPGASLWSHAGWVRGAWPIKFGASDPSGVCSTEAVIAGQTLEGPSAVPDSRVWQQCPTQTFQHWVNTADYVKGGQGSFPLTLKAVNAAGVWTSSEAWTRRVFVDNVVPTVKLSGPTDALSTDGRQYVTATATAGPSGVAGISCSVDSGPAQWFAASSARLAVQGLGPHHISCIAANHAADADGQMGASSAASWALSIRQPTVSTASFDRLVDVFRCKKRRERVRIPAQWITERIHGRSVRVRIPAQTRTITVMHCHPRIVKRRVRVRGHWKTERVVVLPHRVRDRSKRVRFGSATSISGWLGTTQGAALAHQRVRIFTAPTNDKRRFRLASVVRTGADGSWSARLRPGPSRLVHAVFGGAATVEPSTSDTAHLTVPASLTMSAAPRQTQWGSTIRIVGRVRGGYIPAGGELVVLRVGWHGGSAEIGHLYTDRDGRFRTTYTFLRGNGTETYRLWAATARESDYPYAAGRSTAVLVTVRP